MMALINNWDLKESNNAIDDVKGEGLRYVVSDLGATFGQTGNAITRSKSNIGEFSGAKCIQKVTADQVDFFFSSRPLFCPPSTLLITPKAPICKTSPSIFRWRMPNGRVSCSPNSPMISFAIVFEPLDMRR